MKSFSSSFNLGFMLMAFFLMAIFTTESYGGQNYVVFTDANEMAVKDNLAGGWEYTVQGAPGGYEKGFLLIIEEKGQYQVQVQTGGGKFIGENVVAKKNTINFTLMVEGEKVTVSLTVDGSKISGKSSSYQGEFLINGVRTLSQG